MPEAVRAALTAICAFPTTGLDCRLETYDQWVASGAHLPSVKPATH